MPPNFYSKKIHKPALPTRRSLAVFNPANISRPFSGSALAVRHANGDVKFPPREKFIV
jgi:hypothetical protein